MGGIWVSIGTSISQTTIDTGIGKATVHESSLSLPLAIIVNKWGVNKGTSSSAQADISTGFLLCNSEGRDKAGNLMDGSNKVSVGSSNSLVTSNSNWDSVTGDNRSMGKHSSGIIWESSIDTGISQTTIGSVQEGGVSLRGWGSLGSNCQQYTGEYLHCSSVALVLPM